MSFERARRLLATSFAGAALCGGAIAQPAVWTVHGPRGTVVLFGSVHLLPGGLDWRPPALTDALARADELWFEIPIDQATDEAAARLAERQGRLAAGDSLWSHLSAVQRDLVARAATKVGLDPGGLAPEKPWMAELSLELAADARSGALASQGVEARIQSDAPPTTRRKALESARQQIGFLAGGDMVDQAASLAQTAEQIAGEEDPYARTVKAWMAGDLAGLIREDVEPLRATAPRLYDRLIVSRNRRWALTVRSLARRDGVSVVVVGAGHLLGPEGLPALLRAKGLDVEGP